MKKAIGFVALALVALVALSSCDLLGSIFDPVLGTWELVKINDGYSDYSMPVSFAGPPAYTLNSDVMVFSLGKKWENDISTTLGSDSYSGYWTSSGDSYKLYSDDDSLYCTLKMNSDKDVLTWLSSYGQTYYYEKQ